MYVRLHRPAVGDVRRSSAATDLDVSGLHACRHNRTSRHPRYFVDAFSSAASRDARKARLLRERIEKACGNVDTVTAHGNQHEKCFLIGMHFAIGSAKATYEPNPSKDIVDEINAYI